MNSTYKKLAYMLNRGGIAVMPSDTIYGVVASALDKSAVERLYEARVRDTGKACIILISSVDELALFDVIVSDDEKKLLAQLWKETTSVILPCPGKKCHYLHRGQETLAFRLVQKKYRLMHDVLQKTGPLSAPSANPQGRRPAETIREAKEYFGDTVDCYVGAGRRVSGRPSRVVRLEKGKLTWLRK